MLTLVVADTVVSPYPLSSAGADTRSFDSRGDAGAVGDRVKDTVIAYTDQVTRIRARFTVAGQYVWHCHIVELEDIEMIGRTASAPSSPDNRTSGDPGHVPRCRVPRQLGSIETASTL